MQSQQRPQPQRSMAKRSKLKKIDLDVLLKGRVLYDNVVVRPLAQDKTSTKKGEVEIIRPDQYEDKPEFGEVLMVGEGRIFDNGTVVPLRVKVGDVVYFQKYSTTKLRIDGTDIHIIREEDIYWTHE